MNNSCCVVFATGAVSNFIPCFWSVLSVVVFLQHLISINFRIHGPSGFETTLFKFIQCDVIYLVFRGT
jgi:hypothetical protein